MVRVDGGQRGSANGNCVSSQEIKLWRIMQFHLICKMITLLSLSSFS